MYRPPTIGDPGGSGAGSNGNATSYWANNRQPSSSANSNESNLREIRDSLVPFRAGVGSGSYVTKSTASSQAALASSSIGSYMETSSSSTNSSSGFWSIGGQQGFSILPPPPQSNGYSIAPTGFDSSFNGGLSSGHFMKTVDAVQGAKFRPTGTHPAYRPTGVQEALSQIKQQLQPYSMTTGEYGAGNMDTLSSESSSGTTGSADMALQNGPLHESILLDQLVQMGFEQESAWYALKLTQFRSLHLAVDVLLKLNMSHVFRDQDTRSSVSRKPSFDNGENGVGRSESPMPRIPTPQGRQQYQTGAALPSVSARSTPSAVSTSGAVYSIPVANQRTPSPMSKPLGSAAMSNYVSVVPPPNFGPTTTAQNAASSSLGNLTTYVNGGEPCGYLGAAGGPKRSHITVNLQSPPRNSAQRNGSAVADSLLVRERAAPVMQADKRQVEKPIAQSAISPTIISVNSNSPSSLLGQSKLSGGAERQEVMPAKQQSTKVLSAHFDPKSLQAVRINVQPSIDPSNGGQYVMKYQLEANTTSGHVVSIQGRGGECTTGGSSTVAASSDVIGIDYARQTQAARATPPSTAMKLSSQRILLSSPLESGMVPSNEALSNHEKAVKGMLPLDYSLVMAQLQQSHQQQQQQLPTYRHHIMVGDSGSGDNTTGMDDSLENHQQNFAQRVKLTNATPSAVYGHQMTGIPGQKRDFPTEAASKASDMRSTPESASSTNPSSAPSPIIPPFVPLPARLALSRTIECFPPLKEESMSQNAPFSTRADRASPTSSVSTEESENSGGGGSSVATLVAGNGNSTEPLVRCESPLPDSVLKRLNQNEEESDQASARTSGNASGSSSSVIKPCTPQAFKFFMEQHIENVIKQHHERQTRRMQLEREMVKALLSVQVQCHMRKLLNNKESNYLRLKRQRMNASMFEKLKTIGLGAFGEVALVRNKDTRALYAMKTLRKSDVIQKNQAAHVKAERDILSEADNEWVVKLFYSFQDKEHLFFIMEYIPGGDMMALLIKKGIFEEDLARFYVAELVCAIQSVHKLGFIHRDIKPDNILIDRNGHIKLTDFGLCTGLRWTHDWKYYAETPKIPGHVYQDSFDLLQRNNPDSNHKVLAYRQQKPRQKSHSLVGTPNYIAPEVLTRRGHTQLCDWWSVGVILYEMVFGHPPFLAATPDETQQKVVHWDKTLRIPEDTTVSPITTDLILRLCCGVEERLGRERNAADIMSHPFFETIDWPRLRSSPAPYKPEILHAMDTSNFDPVEPRPDLPGAGAFGTDKMSKHDHAFYEFTFRRFFDSDGHGCPTLKSKQQYHHPSLDTVLERSNGASASEEVEEQRALRSTSGHVSRAGGYSRMPMYVNERGMNILRISMDDRGRHPMAYEEVDGEEDAEAVFSGPGRPRAEDSFSYDDPTQAQASDVDGETSDSAVYV